MEQQPQFGQDPNGMQPNGGQEVPPNGQPPQDPNGAPPQQNGVPPQQNGAPPQQNGQQPQPTFSEPGKDDEQPVQNMAEPQQEQPMQQQQPMGQDQKSELERPFEKDVSESLKKKLYECNGTACPKSIKQFEGFVKRKIEVLQNKRRGKRRAGEGVGLLFGLPTIEKNGKKIKGILAYAGVSLNNRIYLPEELAKGDGLTLPLLLNHSNVSGAEEELDRLESPMKSALENGEDFQIGWVTLRWEPDELTLYYEGIIEHPFFQKEVDDADMAVSLGIWYDSDSPQVCDEECYTLIRGAEFREVSLVYHPGFPIATIEAVEVAIRQRAKKQIADEANWNKGLTTTATGTNNLTAQFNFTAGSTDDTFLFTQPQLVANEERTDYRLQPKMSLPKTTGELKIPNNPKVERPQDTMKQKKKAQEDKKKAQEDKKKAMRNSKRKSTQEKRRVSSRQKGKARNLEI